MRKVFFGRGVVKETKDYLICGINLASRCYAKHNKYIGKLHWYIASCMNGVFFIVLYFSGIDV